MNLATLVNADGLSAETLARASVALRGAGGQAGVHGWVEPDIAADLPFEGLALRAARAAIEAAVDDADVVVQPAANRRRRLLIADMDSTMITVECIDELADYAGIKPQVAAVTEAAMRGELDFVGALDARVALLKDLPATTIDRCHAERVRLMAGARALVRTMRANGAFTVLVSGGFTAFADRVAEAIGFERAIANELLIADGRLTGAVARPVVTAEVKRATLLSEAQARGIALADCLAVGDGANDIPMIEAAGLGIAYHAKPKPRDAADAAVRRGDLTVLLYAQGYARAEWAD